MTDAERETRLAELAKLPRVWGNDHGCGDATPGLIELCREWVKPDFVLAEVGCFAGVSTRVLACFAAEVWAVDAWELAAAHGYKDLSAERLREARFAFAEALRDYPHVALMVALSAEAARRFDDGVLDAVYLDAGHTLGEFAQDVRAWLPKLKPAGLLMGHDWSQVRHHFEALGLPEATRVYSEDSWVTPVETIRRDAP